MSPRTISPTYKAVSWYSEQNEDFVNEHTNNFIKTLSLRKNAGHCTKDVIKTKSNLV